MLVGICLMVIGFVLVGVEMVTPGFSIPGISGAICLVASVFVLADTIKQGILLALGIVVVLIIMLVSVLRLLSKGKMPGRLVLTEELNEQQGYMSSTKLNYLQGKKGVAHTDLRPTGVGDFDGTFFDVLSEGSYISKGTPIIVKKVEGSKLIVRVEK